MVGVNRGFGLYGDMVISLTSGDKLELRSIPECALSRLLARGCDRVGVALMQLRMPGLGWMQ